MQSSAIATALNTRAQPNEDVLPATHLLHRKTVRNWDGTEVIRAVESVRTILPVTRQGPQTASRSLQPKSIAYPYNLLTTPLSARARVIEQTRHGFTALSTAFLSFFRRATTYRKKLDTLFGDFRMQPQNGQLMLDLCTFAINPAHSNEFEDLQGDWKTLMEDSVSAWKLYTTIESIFAVFIYTVLQNIGSTDAVSYSVAYLAIGSVGVGFAVNRLLVSWLDNDECKTYHYALHVKARRIDNQTRFYPSHEALFSLGFRTLVWSTLSAAAIFLYSMLQATNGGDLLSQSATFVIVARVIVACILLIGASCLWSIQHEFGACQADMRGCKCLRRNHGSP
ncbi:hypothetical protein MIND_00781100 [Mycena indigotica]|uniref:Uncharacterized protein n=1 Tax=Mycena indigotica TaxID=2126181 RepID=A0A8H6SM44_9AGAR|nr:uncharacterized protein MIND_00781100 [Mycena indigotica]KAF7302143.1 hypothetical protein MIND_00781100 [Mycena indigotica]